MFRPKTHLEYRPKFLMQTHLTFVWVLISVLLTLGLIAMFELVQKTQF